MADCAAPNAELINRPHHVWVVRTQRLAQVEYVGIGHRWICGIGAGCKLAVDIQPSVASDGKSRDHVEVALHVEVCVRVGWIPPCIIVIGNINVNVEIDCSVIGNIKVMFRVQLSKVGLE